MAKDSGFYEAHGSDLLYLLCWHDALERLDTLILEIRHLQVSILHRLRESDFYLALRYEERHLWGTTWCEDEQINQSDKNSRRTLRNTLARDLVRIWTLPYPAPADIRKETAVPKWASTEWETINKKQTEHLGKIWLSSTWSRDQRRHYHTLWGLQQLKRKIFEDKLILCQQAIRLQVHRSSNNDRPIPRNKSTLLIVTSGVRKKLDEYIFFLRNFQNAFNKSMDSGIQDHPRPSIERRRELGIYMDYLSERSKDILRDINLLLDYMGVKSYRTTKVVYHRWRHDFTSTTRHLDIDLGEPPDQEDPLPSSIRFVNTSYYMPERADLQPVIAHEVAHAAVRDRLDNLDGVSLGAAHDHFSNLIALIQNAITNFSLWPGMPRTDVSTLDLSREIACDLLAASVKGYAYLYSLFLETVGFGVEALLAGREGKIDLSNIEDLGGGTPGAALNRQWYLRIKVTLSWLRHVHHLPEGELGSLLLSGIDTVLNDFNDYLDSLLVDADPRRGKVWKVLAKRLSEIVETSSATSEVQKWRDKRSKDGYKPDKRGIHVRGDRVMPRSMARIHKDVREALYQLQLHMKMEPGRPLRECRPYTPIRAFRRYYGAVPLEGKHRHRELDKESNTLFKHLYDIPWQAALMRAMDIVGGVDKSLNIVANVGNKPVSGLLKELHLDFPLGRELFSFALEFYLWSSEPAVQRLSCVIDIVEQHVVPRVKELAGDPSLSQDEKKKLDELARVLELWLGQHEAVDKSEKSRPLDEDHPYSAKALIRWYQATPPRPSDKYRLIERRAGYALGGLLEHLQSTRMTTKVFQGLIQFLSTRSAVEIRKGKTRKDEFIEKIVNSLAWSSDHDTGGSQLRNVMLGRVSTGGLYPSSGDNEKHRNIRDILADNGRICKDHPYLPDNPIYMRLVLGRYDAVIWGSTRSICRCALPYFPVGGEEANELSAPEELFPPFFTRREMALVGRFHNVTHFKECSERNPIAFFAVTLQKRQYRLDFIYRLFCSIGLPQAAPGDTIEGAATFLTERDFYFLTDGWGDLVIAFTIGTDEAISAEKLLKIFKFQGAVFQDFMVDRTELILTPDAFDCALHDNAQRTARKEDAVWKLRAQVRLVEDRGASFCNKKVVDHFEIHKKQYGTDELPADLVLSQSPGRMDYVLEFEPPRAKNAQSQTSGYYGKVLTLIDPIHLDRVDSLVSKICDNPSIR